MSAQPARFVVGVALALSGCSAPRESARQQPPVTSLPVAPATLRPDPEDRNPRLARRAREAVRERPVLQLLPWAGDGISIELRGVTTDGRPVLLVRTSRGAASARRAYRDFLRRAGDDAAAYAPTFRTR